MKNRIILQRIDPVSRAYRWYEISIDSEEPGLLFGESKVIIRRGRIGEKGETIVRLFDSSSDGERYFDQKLRERKRRGYVEVQEVAQLSEDECELCLLARTAGESEPTFVYAFRHSAVLLNWDQSYLGRSMLVFKKHVPDFFRLAPSELLACLGEIRSTEIAIRKAFGAQMMNYLFMGNRSGHVHLHLVPRYAGDPSFGSSPFLDTGRTMRPSLPSERYREIAEAVRKHVRGRETVPSE